LDAAAAELATFAADFPEHEALPALRGLVEALSEQEAE
jgi:hypothetical protein